MDWHFIFNLGIAISYYMIPAGIMTLTVKVWREITPFFRYTLIKFGLFICACATGHLLDAYKADHILVNSTHGITFFVSAVVAAQMPGIAKQSVRFIREATALHRSLTESEARFHQFLNTSSRLGAWIKSSESINLWFNQTLINHYGLEGLNKRDDEWLPPAVASEVLANDQLVLESGQPYEVVEIVPTPSGEIRYWLSQKFLLRSQGQVFIAGIAVDITDRQKLTEALEASNQDLEQFAYAASHDLRTPVRGISGLLAILMRKLEGKLDNSTEMICQQIIKDCSYANDLIDGILEYSRAGQAQQQIEPIDVDEVLCNIVLRFREVLHECGGTVHWQRLPVVRGDKVQIGQAFENLIGNAIKYRSEKPPNIEIRVQPDLRCWVFAVIDNGIGIEPEYQDQLFTMFKRLHGRGQIEGTGIGLALIKKIAQRHGGDAWMESEGADCGSTFWFAIKK